MKKTIGNITNKLTGEVYRPYLIELRKKFNLTMKSTGFNNPRKFLSYIQQYTGIQVYEKEVILSGERKGIEYQLCNCHIEYSTLYREYIRLAIFFLVINNLD